MEGTWPGQPQRNGSFEREKQMLRSELLKPDLLSEIVLLVTGALIFAFLLLIALTALTRA